MNNAVGTCNLCLDRHEYWTDFINESGYQYVAEVGVWKGEFAAAMLSGCPNIKQYFMIDPWAHLDNWNKPFNVDNSEFENIRAEAMSHTQFASDKITELRYTTKDACAYIGNEALDFAYIDGDHTLRGITLDLNSMYPKLKLGGAIGGDDFSSTPWQHSADFEPTLVFPYAVYFAEAMDVPIVSLGANQFVIYKDPSRGFSLTDLTGKYGNIDMRTLLETKNGTIGL